MPLRSATAASCRRRRTTDWTPGRSAAATVASVLELRRATVTAADGAWLQTDLGPAWSDPALHPPAQVGDDVVVNVQARELGLGSGGYDVVVVNLTRGLEAADRSGAHVMKLNYTPLQH